MAASCSVGKAAVHRDRVLKRYFVVVADHDQGPVCDVVQLSVGQGRPERMHVVKLLDHDRVMLGPSGASSRGSERGIRVGPGRCRHAGRSPSGEDPRRTPACARGRGAAARRAIRRSHRRCSQRGGLVRRRPSRRNAMVSCAMSSKLIGPSTSGVRPCARRSGVKTRNRTATASRLRPPRPRVDSGPARVQERDGSPSPNSSYRV